MISEEVKRHLICSRQRLTIKWVFYASTSHDSVDAFCFSDQRRILNESMRSTDRSNDDEDAFNESAFSDRHDCERTSSVSLLTVLHNRGRKYIEWACIRLKWRSKDSTSERRMTTSDLIRAWYSQRRVFDNENDDFSASCKELSRRWWLSLVVCTLLSKMKWWRRRACQWFWRVQQRRKLLRLSSSQRQSTVLSVVVEYQSSTALFCIWLWSLSREISRVVVFDCNERDRLSDTSRVWTCSWCWRWIFFSLERLSSVISAFDVKVSSQSDDWLSLFERLQVFKIVVDQLCDSFHWWLSSRSFVTLSRDTLPECWSWYISRDSSSERRWSCDVAESDFVATHWWSLYTR